MTVFDEGEVLAVEGCLVSWRNWSKVGGRPEEGERGERRFADEGAWLASGMA